MKLTVSILFCVCFCLVSATRLSAKEWRGLVPLHSTREDVTRLFNECASQNEHCEFSLGQETIRIVFSGDGAVNYSECPKQLAPGTVLLIEAEPKTTFPLNELHINKKRYKTFDPSLPRNVGYRGYIDEEEGLIIKTYMGQVLQTSYIAAAKDKNLCSRYNENPKALIQVVMEHVPIVLFQCPTRKPQAGEKLVLSADYARTGHHVIVSWGLSAGKLIGGQGTRTITVDTTGLEGQTITVTVERADESGLVAFASCEIEILSKAIK
jgi:hypothetical protein